MAKKKEKKSVKTKSSNDAKKDDKKLSNTDWTLVRTGFWAVLIAAIFAGILSVFAISMVIENVEDMQTHLNGLELELEQNRNLTEQLIAHYPQFVQLTYNTLEGILKSQQVQDIQIERLANETGVDITVRVVPRNSTGVSP